MTTRFNRRAFMASAAGSAFVVALPAATWAQGAAPLPPRPTPEQWAKSPALEHVCLSPGATKIAYIREEGGSKFLYEYTIADNKFQTFNVGTAKVVGLRWIDEVHVALSTISVDKLEAFSGGRSTWTIVSIYNLQNKSIRLLYRGIPGFDSFVAGEINTITVDGKRQITAAGFPVNADEFKYLYSFDLDKDLKYTLLDRAPWETRNWVMSPTGELIARSIVYRKADNWVLEYRVGNDWKEIYSVKGRGIDYPSLIGLARDGKSLIVYRDEDDGPGHYYEVSPEGTFSAPIKVDGYNAGPIFDKWTFRMCGTSSYDGWGHANYDSPIMQGLVQQAQKAMDGYRLIIQDRAEDPSKMILYTEGDDDAGTYYFVDFKTGKSITIGEAYPDIPFEWLSIKKVIKYKAADGLEIEAYLSLPPNREAKNLPLVVHPHGGPAARDGIEYDRETQAYTSRGYAVLQPNYRGSAGYGAAFLAASYGEWGKKMQTDLSDGVRYLAAQGLVDPKRVCIVGASYGGYAALAGPTLDPSVYNCAVSVAGVSDLRAMLNWSRGYNSGNKSESYEYWLRQFGGEANLDSSSPVKNVKNVKVPILLVHGKDDTVVPFEQSTSMVSALKTAGKDVTFVDYAHEDHWETNETARTDMYKLIVDFIEKHNPAA